MQQIDSKLDILKKYILSDQNKFYRLAYSYTKNSDEAADVVQEAICKAIEKVNTLRKIEYVKTWFYRILINESLNYIRKNKRYIQDERISDNAIYEDKDIAQSYTVLNAIFGLEPKMRTIVILRYYEDMKLTEIAKVTSCNVNTVKSRLYKALDLLKVSIGGDDFE
ncbi:RNA polymerase sigma factor [Clostridium sp. E02]|uniref:RNA polymerase sigma factor n=1 Tax=Clostridium sp. E02 TaxID=2487134 RepID=UPI001FA9FAEB|nr:RNA polymerase sigma factor [Clostridium sp. E02]